MPLFFSCMPEAVLEEIVSLPQLGTGLGPYPARTSHPELSAEIISQAQERTRSWRIKKCDLWNMNTIWHYFLSFHSTSYLVVEN